MESLAALSALEGLLTPEWFAEARGDLGLAPDGASLFTDALVCRLMVGQSLDPGSSLRAAVAGLRSGAADGPESLASPATGGYSRGRSRLPLAVAERAADAVLESLRGEEGPGVWLLDGSSLLAPSTPELRRAYPPATNQRGESHWPVIRVVVAHELSRGLAARPGHGPMYGPGAVSEQALAEGVLSRLPEGARVVGDRNFGVFSVAWACAERGLVPLVRLTASRARRVCRDLAWGEERPVVWEPSREDRRAHPGLPEGARLEGRLVSRRLFREGGWAEVLLFTTNAGTPAEELVGVYGRRWDVETDLRTLKSTLRLETLRSRTPDMAAKELVLAVAAYGLVRSLMAEAAALRGLDPRRLSFAGALAYVRAFARNPGPGDRLLGFLAEQTLPDRRGRESPPRGVWAKPSPYPARKNKRKEDAA